MFAEQLAEQEPLRLLQLSAEVVRAHAVRLIDDDQVPFSFLELRLELLVAGQLVHPGDQERVGLEDIEVDVGVNELVGQQVEPQPELEEQLVLPLLHQATWRDDQALPHVVAEKQLFDVQAGHDRLPGAGIVGKQEAQRGTRKQLAVHRTDLVRQRPYVAGGDGQHRVEQPGQRNPLGLGDELEVGSRCVERTATGLRDAELVLVLPEHHLLAKGCPRWSCRSIRAHRSRATARR